MNTRPKRLLVLIGAASLLLIGIATVHLETSASAGVDPLRGISAAENAPVGAVGGSALAQLQTDRAWFGGDAAAQILSGARAIASVNGHQTYLVPTSRGTFCLFVEQDGEACTLPLTPSSPVLFVASDPDGPGGAGPTVYGVALDGVSSITFTEAGVSRSVAVNHNEFEFDGASSADPAGYMNIVADFVDGHTVPVK